jgi:putative transposase
MPALLTDWKRTADFGFLNEVSCVPLQQVLRHLRTAFANCFDKRAKYPRFKSKKRSLPSSEYTRSAFRWRAGQLTLAKMPELLAIRWVATAHRVLGKKTKGSRNREKARLRVARVYARITDRRRDLLHKISTRLVRESHTIVIEGLNNAGMVRNHHVAQAIQDASWSEFRPMLEYKADRYRRTVIVVDRWLPSSKTCSDCGRVKASMPPQERVFRCECGLVMDRDINAARDTVAAGRVVTACGAGRRPVRRNSSATHLAQPPFAGNGNRNQRA